MKTRLFIIGNGFDLAHKLPTHYENNFKIIAEKNESVMEFWELYSFEGPKIWSDFENCLAHPDFNTLEEIFDGYFPDYSSDHESDRTAIITQVDISGNLHRSLSEFAEVAEKAIDFTSPLKEYKKFFNDSDIFITFNYTHTLEKLYNIDANKILHIHGEVGKNNLLLGYPKGNYQPVKYRYYSIFEDGGRYIDINIRDYVKRMAEEQKFDSYVTTAYELLIDKTQMFYKKSQIESFSNFLKERLFDEIVVIGHSCKIDFEYFKWLRQSYPKAQRIFNPHSEDDTKNIYSLISLIELNNYIINEIR